MITGAFAQKLDRSKVPAPAPAPKINLSQPATFTLPNGLKVFVVENHKLPKVAFSLSLDVDPVLEGDMKGYVDITGQLLERGTTNRTKQQLDEEIDFIGATLSTSANGVYASSLKKHQAKILEILSDVVLNSDFKQEELDKLKKQTISGIASSKDDPDAIAANVRSVLVYGKKHPYGEITTEETVENVTLEACKNYYKTYFRPNVSYLAVVGDVSVKEIQPLIEKYFASWEKSDVPVNKYKMPTAPKQTEVAFVHKEGASQSVINITYPVNLKKSNPDVVKTRILNSILGGSATARLFMNLREKHGYTYGAYSTLSADELVGYFNANAKVRNDVTDSALTQFMVELNRIADEKVSAEELQGMKNYASGIFAYTLQDPQTIARFAIETEKYKLPADYYATYMEQIAAVTIDDVKEMAEKYITPNNAIILVVGNKKIADKLVEFDANQKINYYDIYGNDYVEALKPAPEGVTAETVMNKYIEAKYGVAKGKALDKKLKKIKDITVRMDATIQGQSINVTRYQKAPNKFANAITMGTMVVQKQAFNGTIGKSLSVQENDEMPEPITVISELSDYKEVNGIMFAHKTKQSFGPQTLDMTVTAIEINTKLGDEVFE